MQSPPISEQARARLKQGQDRFFGDPPDYIAAAKAFREAIELAPAWGEAFYWLSGALENRGDYREAIKMGRKAIGLLPNDPRPSISLGQLMKSIGRYAEAVRLLEQGLRLKPHYGEADALCMLAESYEALGKIRKAAKLWRQVVKMKGFYPSHELPMEEARAKLAKHGLA
jgi:tetratricopeptide (TPR) repeat protein